MINIFICDFVTGAKYNIIVEASTTLEDLKKKFCIIKKDNNININEKDIYAWFATSNTKLDISL